MTMRAFYSEGASPRVFLATPISSIDGDTERAEIRALSRSFVSSVVGICPAAAVCSEILDHSVAEEYESPDAAATEDFGAISACSHFVLVYPRPLATSALMELGYAMAMDIPCLIYANNVNDLPYLARPAEESGGITVLPIREFGSTTSGLSSFLEKRAVRNVDAKSFHSCG